MDDTTNGTAAPAAPSAKAPPTDLTPENAPILRRMVMQEAHRVKKAKGVTLGEGIRTAADTLGAALVPPVTGKDLLSVVARDTGKDAQFRKGQASLAKNGQTTLLPIEVLTGKETLMPPPLTGRSKHAKRAVNVYMAYCRTSDWVPPDQVLAEFTGFSSSIYSKARAMLRAQGFVFARNGHGWNIEAPKPAEPEPEPVLLQPEPVPALVVEIVPEPVQALVPEPVVVQEPTAEEVERKAALDSLVALGESMKVIAEAAAKVASHFSR